MTEPQGTTSPAEGGEPAPDGAGRDAEPRDHDPRESAMDAVIDEIEQRTTDLLGKVRKRFAHGGDD